MKDLKKNRIKILLRKYELDKIISVESVKEAILKASLTEYDEDLIFILLKTDLFNYHLFSSRGKAEIDQNILEEILLKYSLNDFKFDLAFLTQLSVLYFKHGVYMDSVTEEHIKYYKEHDNFLEVIKMNYEKVQEIAFKTQSKTYRIKEKGHLFRILDLLKGHYLDKNLLVKLFEIDTKIKGRPARKSVKALKIICSIYNEFLDSKGMLLSSNPKVKVSDKRKKFLGELLTGMKIIDLNRIQSNIKDYIQSLLPA